KEQAEQAKQFADASTKIGKALQGIADAAANKAIERLLPKFQALAEWFEGEGGQGLRDGAEAVANAIIAAFEGVEYIAQRVIDAFNALRDAVAWANGLFTASEERSNPPSVRLPGDAAPSEQMMRPALPNDPSAWQKQRQ